MQAILPGVASDLDSLLTPQPFKKRRLRTPFATPDQTISTFRPTRLIAQVLWKPLPYDTPECHLSVEGQRSVKIWSISTNLQPSEVTHATNQSLGNFYMFDITQTSM